MLFARDSSRYTLLSIVPSAGKLKDRDSASSLRSGCNSSQSLRSAGLYIKFWIHQASTVIVLVLQPGVRPEPLRWESRVQDIGPPEISWPHIISNGKSSPRALHLNAKTQLHSKTSKLQCWTPHAKQLARQEHSPPISREAA